MVALDPGGVLSVVAGPFLGAVSPAPLGAVSPALERAPPLAHPGAARFRANYPPIGHPGSGCQTAG